MKLAALLLVSTLPLTAAEEAPKSTARDALKARIAEDAKKTKPTAAAPAPEATPNPNEPAPAAKATGPTVPAKKENAAAAKQPATVLPKVEVKKGRITELDQKLAKQEQDIAREAKNTKSSELDNALNDSKVARPLAIFGGDSTQFRKGVASERVELMEAEKDLIEAIAHAKTKEEKAALQKQLDELKAMRRQLDKSLR
jgi:hypothetical protein